MASGNSHCIRQGLYKSFGIVIFYDMYPRAQKAKEIEEHIRLIDKTRAGLVDKLKRLKMGNEDS